MTPLRRAQVSVAITSCLVLAAAVVISIEGSSVHSFFRAGPSPDLSLLGVKVDSWDRYWTCMGAIAAFSIIDALSTDWSLPYFSFRVYNPDCKRVTDVGKLHLWALSTHAFAMYNFKIVLLTISSITQADFAIARVFAETAAGGLAAWAILGDKEFVLEDDVEACAELVSDYNQTGGRSCGETCGCACACNTYIPAV